MIDKLEVLINASLFTNEEYARHVLPFIKKEYFSSEGAKQVFLIVERFFNKYNKIPTIEAISIELNAITNLSEPVVTEARDLLKRGGDMKKQPELKFLVDKTEVWCRERATYNAVVEAISIINGNHKTLQENALPDLFKDAIAISFDTRIGHEYIPDAESRFDAYHAKEDRLSCDLTMLNTITDGGFPRKTLNVLLASTGVGKSLFMCHLATSYIKQGKNVLYITLEMSEERIAERIDANLMDVRIQDLKKMSKQAFMSKVKKIKEQCSGELVIKEYPTGGAHVNHFRALLQDLKAKREFIPDVICVDYLNICASSRAKLGNGLNSYSVVKAIAEELRGLAVEQNCVVISATQTTRSGTNNSDVELTDVSESIGLPQTTDFFAAVMSNEKLVEQGVVMMKQLKNRYGDISSNSKFLLGIDRSKMRVYDSDETIQSPSKPNSDRPVFDTTDFGKRSNSASGLNFNN